jgi:hypothetical protein
VRGHALNEAIIARGDASVLANPDNALDCAIVGRGGAIGEQKVWLGIGPAEVEDAGLFLLAAGEEVLAGRRDGDGANDMVVGEGVQHGAVVRVPDLARCGFDVA